MVHSEIAICIEIVIRKRNVVAMSGLNDQFSLQTELPIISRNCYGQIQQLYLEIAQVIFCADVSFSS